VIGDHALGSVEYGMEHLGAKLVVVLGHTHCGAVDAALNGGAHGYIATITDEISACLPAQCDPREAEKLNVENSISCMMASEIVTELTETGEARIVGAIYDIESGTIEFLD
jgi:carbonic anhydrase